jgi:tRNA-dihydrouridine synthase B
VQRIFVKMLSRTLSFFGLLAAVTAVSSLTSPFTAPNAVWHLANTPFVLGGLVLANRVFVAPMAGVTDRPYRQLCKRLGAGYAVAEMAASNPALWATVKTARRTNHEGEMNPTSVQLAGADPLMMAQAARFNVERGAQIIDINMGCPAKKVCNVWAGSALMANLELAQAIIQAVVNAVDVPVTIKMRTGPTPEQRNAPELAKRAEQAGAAMVTVHARSRACAYAGPVAYEAIEQVKRAVSIPVVANGDIDSGPKALSVLQQTGADAVMIGRAAQGRPWLPGQIAHYLATGETPARPNTIELQHLLMQHLQDHYAFYGEFTGVRNARKHISWYLEDFQLPDECMQTIYRAQTTQEQLDAVNAVLETA